MSSQVCTGIDVGTHQVKVVIAKQMDDGSLPRILGTGSTASEGVRHGSIVNPTEVTRCVIEALQQAQRAAGLQIEEGFVSIGGAGVGSIHARGTAAIHRADGEITETDTAAALQAAEQRIERPRLQNRRVIHSIPLAYAIDGEPVIGNPVGMSGRSLEVDALFVTAFDAHVTDLIEAVEGAGVEVLDVMAAPLAAGLATLSKSQKIAGCVLANVGAETVSTVVFENDVPISLEVFDIGSTDITNDIALGLKVPLEDAQRIKHGDKQATEVPKKKLEQIIKARCADIFELIDTHLSHIKRRRMLPAGIVITGGGGALDRMSEYAQAALELPSRVASVQFATRARGNARDPRWAIAYGMCIFGLSSDATRERRGGVTGWLKKLVQWVKQFLP